MKILILMGLAILINSKQYLVIAQNSEQINSLQYYFNTDPGQGIVGNGAVYSITSSTNYSQLESMSIGSFSEGIHHLYVRVKDQNNVWSIAERRMIYLQNVTLQTVKNIEAYQYYFDTDPGVGNIGNGNIVSIPSTNNFNQTLLINVPVLSEGAHHLYLRVKNEDDSWSLIERRMLYLQNVTFLSVKNVVAYQYYFDTDPGVGNVGNGNMVSIPSTNNFNQTISMNIPALADGIHHVYIRVKNEDGAWSVVERRMIYIKAQQVVEIPNMVAMEYYIDTDPGIGMGISIPMFSTPNISSIVNASPLGATIGNHFLYIRVMDSLGHWSITDRDSFNVSLDSLQLKFFIEGFYTGSGFMQQVLLNQGQQFNSLTTDVDTFLVEFRDTLAPYDIVNKFKGVLQTDGTLHCLFPQNTNYGSYFVVIKGRNTIATWSATPLPISNQFYNFTSNVGKAYGENQLEIESGVWAFYSGDINQDENSDLLDASILETSMAIFDYGYFATDLNGDGNVDLLDSPILEVNSNNFVYSIKP